MCAGSKPGHSSGERIARTCRRRREQARHIPKHVRRRAVTGGPGVGSAMPPCVLHHRHERIARIDAGDRRLDVVATADLAAIVIGAGGAAPRDLDDALFIGGRVGETCRSSEGSCVSFEVVMPRAIEDAVSTSTGVIESNRPAPSWCRPKPAQILIATSSDCRRARTCNLQIAKSVERIGAAAGGNAAAVLRPRAGVLDVPELAVAPTARASPHEVVQSPARP